MTITAIERTVLKQTKGIATDRNGVDAWGLYLVLAEEKAGYLNERRVFVADRVVCSYTRRSDSGRTTWKKTVFPDRAQALVSLTAQIVANERVMVGAPVLVQLTEGDVETVRRLEMPNARYRGQARHESLYGKFDAVTDSLVNMKPDFNKAISTRAAKAPDPVPATAAATTSGPIGDEPF